MFASLQGGVSTPLELSRATKISRTAVYAILAQLTKRGLATSHITHGRKHWGVVEEREVEAALYETKRALMNIPDGKQELYRQADTTIVLHRGEVAVKKLIEEIFKEHKGERYQGLQGDRVFKAWRELLGANEINTVNRFIKENRLIGEAILSEGYFLHGAKQFGPSWAKDFEGRTYRMNEVGREYFEHGAEMLLFKESLYLISMSEALIIEIKHSEIQKMILSFFRYIQDNSPVIDANEVLRGIIAQQDQKAPS